DRNRLPAARIGEFAHLAVADAMVRIIVAWLTPALVELRMGQGALRPGIVQVIGGPSRVGLGEEGKRQRREHETSGQGETRGSAHDDLGPWGRGWSHGAANREVGRRSGLKGWQRGATSARVNT